MTSSPRQIAASALEVNEIELTSSPEDLIHNEALRVEKQIRDDDSILSYSQINAHHGDGTDISIYGIPVSDNDNRTSPVRRKRLKDYKVEVPLTPLDSSEPPTKRAKTVSFSETLQTTIHLLDSEMAFSETDEDGLRDFIEDIVQPLTDSAQKHIEGEQLEEFDTTLRVVVPEIDDSLPNASWETPMYHQPNQSRLDPQTTLISRIEEYIDENERKWSGVQRSARLLSWTPFPARLGEIHAEEELEDGSLAEYFEQLEIDHGAEDFTRTRLNLLKDGDDLLIELGDPLNSDDEVAVQNNDQGGETSRNSHQNIAANASTRFGSLRLFTALPRIFSTLRIAAASPTTVRRSPNCKRRSGVASSCTPER